MCVNSLENVLIYFNSQTFTSFFGCEFILKQEVLCTCTIFFPSKFFIFCLYICAFYASHIHVHNTYNSLNISCEITWTQRVERVSEQKVFCTMKKGIYDFVCNKYRNKKMYSFSGSRIKFFIHWGEKKVLLAL